LRSDFDFSSSTKKLINSSFGAPREAFEKVYVPSLKVNPDKTIPGPGEYTQVTTIGKDSRKFSL
jgi:hypothetical protein